MRIGIACDLKIAANGANRGAGFQPASYSAADRQLPDDFQEEFDSPATVEAIADVLRGLGHDVQILGDGRELLERLLAEPPDFVFNIAEGEGIGRSREARAPAVLEMLGIPYSGSDPLTLAVTLDKDCAKRLVASAGIAVPRGRVMEGQRPGIGAQKSEVSGQKSAVGGQRPEVRSQAALGLTFPVIVKPAWEGSSKGIRSHCLVERVQQLGAVLESLQSDYQQPVLVEEYIQGDEITVGIVGNDSPHIIGMMRVLPSKPTEHFIYSVDVKRDFRREVRYESPPQLGRDVIDSIAQSALEAYRVLGCRDVARVDFRVHEGVPYFLEVNPLPGLNPDSSDLVILAGLCGWSYARLVKTIFESALNRCLSGGWVARPERSDGRCNAPRPSLRSGRATP
jgi:D-alanine-D-alanine ligase